MLQIVETKPAGTDLAIVVEQNQLPADRAQPLLDSFQPLFVEAQEIIHAAQEIQVVDATQLTEMKQAREMRLKLRAVRGKVESLRKTLKEESLRTGKAIDGMANVLKYLIEPVEERLERDEKFAERAEADRKAKLKAAREELMKPFNVDVSYYDLANMPEATFAQLLENSRLSHEARIAAAAKAEADRIAAEQARIAEEARIRAENDRLRMEAEKQAKLAALERAKAEADRRAIEEKALAEREAIQRKADAERAEAAAKARAEREAAERKAAEERRRLEAAAAAERVERERLEREARERAEAEASKRRLEEAAKRKAARAPDKDKIRTVAKTLLALELPQVASSEAVDMLGKIRGDILDLANRITHLADSL